MRAELSSGGDLSSASPRNDATMARRPRRENGMTPIGGGQVSRLQFLSHLNPHSHFFFPNIIMALDDGDDGDEDNDDETHDDGDRVRTDGHIIKLMHILVVHIHSERVRLGTKIS